MLGFFEDRKIVMKSFNKLQLVSLPVISVAQEGRATRRHSVFVYIRNWPQC